MADVIYTWPPEIDANTVWTDWKADFVSQDAIDNSLGAPDTFEAILKELEGIEVSSQVAAAYAEALRELKRLFDYFATYWSLSGDDIILDCGMDIEIGYNFNNHNYWLSFSNAGFASAISSKTNVAASLLAFRGAATKDRSNSTYGWNISQSIANIKTMTITGPNGKSDGGTGVWCDLPLPWQYSSRSNTSSTFYRVSSGFSYNPTSATSSTSITEHIYFRASSLALSSRDATNPNGSDTATSGKYPSGALGGLGTFDDTTALSDISTKPTLNIFNLGFYSLWNPTATELRNLSAVVWNDPTNYQQWPQLIQDGVLHYLDYIPSLGLFPIASSALTTQVVPFCMGGIIFDGRAASLMTTINMAQITEQIIDIDMGEISLLEYFGSFLDYAPYTQVSLYLPFFGVVELSANEIQNADHIKIVYRVNLFDGATAIKIHIEKLNNATQNNSVNVKHVLYEYNTNIKTEIPLTGGANSEHLKTLATLMAATAATVAAPIAGAGASALAGGIEGATTLGGIEGAAMGAAIGNAEVGAAVSGAVKTGAQAVNKAVNSLPSGGGIHRGNNGSMGFGLLGERKPFLIVNRPIQVLPADYQQEKGYTASIKTTLVSIQSGYIRCDAIDTSGIACEEKERVQLINLLCNEGVYL